MPIGKEKKPFVIEFKNNYGTVKSGGIAQSPSTRPSPTGLNKNMFVLHGQHHVTLRDHCHRQRTEGVDKKARKKLIIASILCLFFMVCEIVGGILSNSLAIATDAAHLLTDFAAFMISLFALWIAGRPSTQRMSYGWYRAEVIGAMASVVMIWVITGILIWLAIQRIINQDYELEPTYMLITSGLAIVVNILMGCQLHPPHGHGGHGHSHGEHGHSHGNDTHSIEKGATTPTVIPAADNSVQQTISTTPSTITTTAIMESQEKDPKSLEENVNLENNSQVGRKLSYHIITQKPAGGTGESMTTVEMDREKSENINVRAAFIHVIGDMVQSIGVFIAALVIYFKPEWAIADPICTFFFSVIVLYTTFHIMKDTLLVLMEGTPSYLDYAEVMEVFLQIEGVERVHNLRIWALSINKIALSAHLAVRPSANQKEILQAATNAVHLKYNFFETTIQIEDFTPSMENCQQCSIPNI